MYNTLMPSRFVVKHYSPKSYYHIYSRGLGGGDLFRDETDFVALTDILKRYLGRKQLRDPSRRAYKHYRDQIDLVAYCLMSNHLHLLLYQKDEKATIDFMRSLLTSYAMYFNLRHKHRGNIFHGRYRASNIKNKDDLTAVSRYIHLTPIDYGAYPHSSYSIFTGAQKADWLAPQHVLKVFKDGPSYSSYVGDYSDYKRSIDGLKPNLANR